VRCIACNKNLNDAESVRKYPESGEFIDLCSGCLDHVPELTYEVRGDLYNDYAYIEEQGDE